MRKLPAALLIVTAIVGSACDPAEEAAPPKRDVKPRVVDLGEIELIGLTTEDSCGPLLEWFKQEATAHVDQFAGYPGVMYYGDRPAELRAQGAPEAGAFAATDAAGETASKAAGVDYSTTNVQEIGVDEPDLVKTDGSRLVALAGGHLRVVDVSGAVPKLVASVPMPGAHDLLLSGDRVIVIGSEATVYPMAERMTARMASDAIAPVPGSYEPKITIRVVDINDPGAPRVVATREIDGSYIAARMTDGVVRLVSRWTPTELMQRLVPATPPPGQPPTPEDTKARATAVIAQSTITDWVPDYVPCEQVHHPKGFTGAGMVTVVAIDPADPRPRDGASVVGAGETVYASADRLYVSSNAWPVEPNQPAGPTTELHAFDISDAITTRYVASGSVGGQLLNQFSLSEHAGVLRVATTTVDTTSGQTESRVVALRQDGAMLREIGMIGGLGKTERIYAVRFLGDLGYVVTFRQTDPLYVLDLSDPAHPQLKGELKIPGYSAYLHPVGDGRLLGVGQDATAEGRRLGAQVSLFDVSDPTNPKQLAKHDLGSYGSSAAEYDHHAFLWWAKANVAVVPVVGGNGSQAVGVAVGNDSLTQRGALQHPTFTPISRSVVIGDRLLTLSDSGILASDVATLADHDWMPF